MSVVSIEGCKNYDIENVRTALDRTFKNIGGISKYIKNGTHVVLKPNLVLKKSPKVAATTHPAIVQVLSEMIISAGGKVTIAESPGGLYNKPRLTQVYSECGIEQAAKNSGAQLNFDLSVTEVENPKGMYLKKVTVISPLAEADLIINLPKLKSHGQMVYTGAVKNMFGAVPGAVKADYHFRLSKYEDFANTLIDVFLSVKPQLNIMDAVVGMDGHGPTAGDPKEIGLLMASEDAFSLDLAALNVVRAEPEWIPMTVQAQKRGLCPLSLNQIHIVGEKLENVKISGFNFPQLDDLKCIGFYDKGIMGQLIKAAKPKLVFTHKICTGCQSCKLNCPAGVITMKNKRPYIDQSKCIRCFCCQELCPEKAISIKRPWIINCLMKTRKKSI